MPRDLSVIAQATAFQQNCGLNVLIQALNDRPQVMAPVVAEEFRTAFNQYYNTNLNAAECGQCLSGITSPVHREILLGPVLRSMFGLPHFRDLVRSETVNPGTRLEDIEIMHLANYFGFRVESYSSFKVQAKEAIKHKLAQAHGEIPAALLSAPTEAEIQAEIDTMGAHAEERNRLQMYDQNIQNASTGANPPVVKLWNACGSHFERILESTAAAAAHNRWYASSINRFPYSDDHALQIKQAIHAALISTPKNFNVSAVLTNFEHNTNSQNTKGSAHTAKSSSNSAKPFAGFFNGFKQKVSEMAKGLGEGVAKFGAQLKGAVSGAGAFASSLNSFASLGRKISSSNGIEGWLGKIIEGTVITAAFTSLPK
jgi:hypothetical protein